MESTALVGRNRDMMRYSRKWDPKEPKIRFSEKGKYLFTRLSLNVAPGVNMTFISRVDLEMIERDMRNGKYDEISGIFGSIFKGIKKAVKTVGKATGLNKVVKFAGKVLKNPLVKAFIPGAALAAGGASIASDIAKATGLARRGKKRQAKKYLQRAYKRSKTSGLSKNSRRRHAKSGTKVYELIVQPK